METFDFPYHTQSTEYPQSGTRVQLGNGYVFTSPPAGPDLRRFDLDFETMLYRLNEEPTSTNWIRNNTNAGAVAPSTAPTGWFFITTGVNAPAVTIVGQGTEDGIPYMDLRIVAGTSAASPTVIIYPGPFNHTPAVAGDVFTYSAYVKFLAKTIVGMPQHPATNLTIQETNSSASSAATGSILITPTVTTAKLSTLRRSYTRTLTNVAGGTAFVRPSLQFTWSAGSAINFTVRIGGFQMEKAASRSSLILTSTGAVTRVQGAPDLTFRPQLNMAVLEAFYKKHKLHKSFIYPHPVYGNTECKFYSPLKIPKGIVGGNGALKDFTVELMEIIQ